MNQKNILIIDTSRAGIGLAIWDKVEHLKSEKQSLELPTAVQNFIGQCGLKFSDLDAIAVVVGPGSFTGIRLSIAYAKGLSIGLSVPVIPLNVFEIYATKTPDAFIAIDSGRGDFFVASRVHEPCTMTIDELESEQMKCPKTVGHIPYDLKDAVDVALKKFETIKSDGLGEPVIPMYLRAHYAEKNCGLK